MTIEERLALDRQNIALDPLNINTFVNYDRWASKIIEICDNFIDNVNIHYTKTSKCQNFTTTLNGEDYIIIDENHIYMMCRYASIVFQIAYAKQYLTGKEKEDLIQNAKCQLDVLYIRYEATFYIYSDNAALFLKNSLEFLQSQEGIETIASQHIDFDRIFCGPNSEEMLYHLEIVNEMNYMMIVLHEVCHCALKNNPNFYSNIIDHLTQFIIEEINILDPELDENKIEIYQRIIQSKSSLEEIACDHFAVTHLLEIFNDYYGDKKLIMLLFNTSWAIMDYNQKVLNVMREMNSLLALFDSQHSKKDEYIKMMTEPILSCQYEYIARQAIINELRLELDLKIFPTKDDYIPELDDSIRKYNSAASELFKYASDFTSMDYINKFFQTISHLEEIKNDPSMRQSFIRLFQWDLSLFSNYDGINVEKICQFNELDFSAYIHTLCSIIYSFNDGILVSKENYFTRFIPDVFLITESGMVANVPIYTDGILTNEIIHDITELAWICANNKMPATLRIFINCKVDDNVKDKLLTDFYIETYDLPKIISIGKTLDITYKRLDMAKDSNSISKYRNNKITFETIDDFIKVIYRFDSRMTIYGVNQDQIFFKINAVKIKKSEKYNVLYFVNSESYDEQYDVSDFQTMFNENDYSDFYLIFIVELNDGQITKYIPNGEISCDISGLEFRLHMIPVE